MKVSLSSVIPADRERVYAALVDPEVLRQAISGCESLVPTGPDEFAATLKIGLAGLKGTYTGKAAIRERRPPDGLTLAFEGKAAPGFVRGTAAIALSPEGAGTQVACAADVQVGGVIAAVGSRLIEAAARKLAAEFFTKLSEQLAQSEGR